jgi:hypothetical protein
MMTKLRNKIANRIKSLEDIDGVEISYSHEKKTIYVKYKSYRSLDFKFEWQTDHYVGYFIDGDKTKSQAVISIWQPLEAIYFSTAYSLLIELRAGRKENM